MAFTEGFPAKGRGYVKMGVYETPCTRPNAGRGALTESEREGMARVEIDEFFCKGCGLCTDVCPKHILELDNSAITDKGYHPAHCIDQSQCIGCATCAVVCPDVAITVWK